MKATVVYANYGILAHEGKPVYRQYKLADAITDKYIVEIPEEIKPYEGEAEQIIVTLDGMQYLLNDVLEAGKDDMPIIEWYNGSRYRRMKLHVVEG